MATPATPTTPNTFNSVATRIAYGIQKEVELRERIEAVIGESILKTVSQTDTIDFQSEGYDIELKSRRKERVNRFTGVVTPLTPDTDPSWLVPCSKAPKGNRVTLWFYHFESDDSLWFLEFDNEEAATWNRGVPNHTAQEHWWVPKKAWSRIG